MAKAHMYCHNISDFRQLARRRLPGPVFDFVDGGAEDEVTLRRNSDEFNSIELLPQLHRATRAPSIAAELFGETYSLPMGLAPCGGLRLVHPDGAVGTVRAASSQGILAIVSSAASFTVEEISEAVPAHRLWFQLYSFGSRGSIDGLVSRAQHAGFGALVVTLDTLAIGNRERDVRNGARVNAPALVADASGALRLNPRLIARYGPAMLRNPTWLWRFLRAGRPFGRVNAASYVDGTGPLGADESVSTVQSPSWGDLEHIRRNWEGPLLVKGILSPEDARRAVQLGVDGVIVSNHGGRQLDGVPATLKMLPSIRQATGSDLTVLVDGGVRRGTDVLKAVALGADAVLIGRPYVWGLATGGEAGVHAVIRVMLEETLRAATLLGCQSVADVDQSWCQF